jgi:hypothetical protein
LGPDIDARLLAGTKMPFANQLLPTHDYQRNVTGVYVCFREMRRAG